MNVQLNQLVKSLLDKESIEQCSLQEVEQYARRHPYFGAAQLLLTKKLQLENHEQYDEQLQKTFLFFHNPLWVEHLLNENGSATIVPAPVPPRQKAEAVVAVPVIPATETEPVTETGVPPYTSLPTEETLPVISDPVIPEKTEEKAEAVVTVPVIPEKETEPVTETGVSSFVSLETEETPPVVIATMIPEKAEEETTVPAPPLVTSAVDLPVFEPYHTVDYFASQGIRYTEEEKPRDKFGLQLKSFTDWLKTMKKLPVSEISKTVEAQSEKKVEQMAEQSLSEREVLTESMAEVWIKQGNPEKALEVYQKLSLLEPSKSVYFAAKIEALQKKS